MADELAEQKHRQRQEIAAARLFLARHACRSITRQKDQLIVIERSEYHLYV